MWYVIQVMTGKEENVKSVIEEKVSRELYDRCFLIKRERVWRREGKCLLHLETLFPGYLFLSTGKPEAVYQELKTIPQFTKLLQAEPQEFLAVEADEKEFLENLIDGDPENVVRLSQVVLNSDKEIVSAEGPLAHYVDRIVKKKVRLRYVMIETTLFGKERTVLVGIRTDEDEGEQSGDSGEDGGRERAKQAI